MFPENPEFCLAPCLVCRKPMVDAMGDENQPLGGTEFVGGGVYGSAVTDHARFYYVINVCDTCIRIAIEDKLVLRMEKEQQSRPKFLYEVLKNSRSS